MGGPVDAGTTYETWFAEQDRERQLEILGPGRMEMYERGVLSVAEIANITARPLTLEELLAKRNETAGIDIDSPELVEYFENIVQKTKSITPCDVPITTRVYTEDDIKRIIQSGGHPDTTPGFHSVTKSGSKRIDEEIVIRKHFVKECFDSKIKTVPGWDGYENHVYDNVPPDLATAMIIAHEMAHIKYLSHGVMHENLTKRYISLLLNKW